MEHEIIQLFIEASGISKEDLLSHSHKQEFVIVRQSIWYSMRCQEFTYTRIGNIFGRKHTTIISGVKCVNNYLLTGDEILKPLLEAINTFYNEEHKVEISQRKKTLFPGLYEELYEILTED